MRAMLLACSLSAVLLSGCAGLDFGKNGLTYFDPTPYLFVAVGKDCVSTATVVSVPGDKKSVHFNRGYGSSKLSLALANGIITNAGQETDTKIPETITSIANWRTAIGKTSLDGGAERESTTCVPTASLYKIDGGVPTTTPINFPVQIDDRGQRP